MGFVTRAYVDVEYNYDVAAMDADGDTLGYALTTFPDGMTIDAITGLLSWLLNSV